MSLSERIAFRPPASTVSRWIDHRRPGDQEAKKGIARLDTCSDKRSPDLFISCKPSPRLDATTEKPAQEPRRSEG
jgi:hypothetical protein